MKRPKFLGRALAVMAVAAGLMIGLIGGGSGSAQYAPSPTTTLPGSTGTVTTPGTVVRRNVRRGCNKIKNRKKRKKCKRKRRRR